MKRADTPASVKRLCALFGKSKQAYYQKQKRIYAQAAQEHLLLKAIQPIRQLMPRIGARKLLVKLRAQGFQIGRDAFFDLLRRERLLVRPRRKKVRTTHSFHYYKKYPNLIQGMQINRPNQLWVSDITYVKMTNGFAFLCLVTDAYSRKILGFQLADSLQAKHAVAALNMAIQQWPARAQQALIHHSDRGIQYCCKPYIALLEKHHINISMTQSGDPIDNAIAERVNGILKTEWLDQIQCDSIDQTRTQVERIIQIYNQQRPHSSIDMLTPQQAHLRTGPLKRHWKNYYRNKINDQLVH